MILEITGAKLNRVQESLQQERGALLTELELAKLEWQMHKAQATQSTRVSDRRASVGSPVVNPYLRLVAALTFAVTQEIRLPRTSSRASPVVNPYTRSTSRQRLQSPSVRSPAITCNASGRRVQLSNQSNGHIFSIGDRVKNTSDLHKTLQRTTFANDYIGRVTDIMACTVVVHTGSSKHIWRHHNNIEKIQHNE